MKNILYVLVLALMAFPVFAAVEEPAVQPEWVKELHETATPEEQTHFYMVYTTYSLIGTVKMVRNDVQRAVKACGDDNPDMKTKMSARFSDWNAAVDPVLSEAEGHVQNMILAQDYVEEDKLRALLTDIDAQREKALGSVDKVPVSTFDACEHLYATMDDTQAQMVSLLRQTLISVPASAAPVAVDSEGQE